MGATGWITRQEKIDFPAKLFEFESQQKSIIPVVAWSYEDEGDGGLR
jgi:hypothetical protein